MIRGAIFNLKKSEEDFCRAVAAGAKPVEAATTLGALKPEHYARRQLRKPIVQAAIHLLTPKPAEELLPQLATSEVMSLALMPDHLLADAPRWVDKRWALETALKLANKFPGGRLAEAGAAAVNLLVEAARRRQLTQSESQTVTLPALEHASAS